MAVPRRRLMAEGCGGSHKTTGQRGNANPTPKTPRQVGDKPLPCNAQTQGGPGYFMSPGPPLHTAFK